MTGYLVSSNFSISCYYVHQSCALCNDFYELLALVNSLVLAAGLSVGQVHDELLQQLMQWLCELFEQVGLGLLQGLAEYSNVGTCYEGMWLRVFDLNEWL